MTNVSEEIARLAELRDKGALSDAEFEAQKAKLLSAAGATTPAADAKTKPGFLKSCLGLVLLAVIILVVIAIFSSGKSGSKDNAAGSDAPAQPPLAVTAKELARAYEANEAAAQRDYGGRPLLVSGTVDGVDLGIADEPTVKLAAINMFSPAMARLVDADKPKAADLNKGQSIKLLCAGVSEVIGTPILDDCAIQ